MNYYEIVFSYSGSLETEIVNDVLAAELGEIGFESFTPQDNGLLAYIAEEQYNKTTLDEKLKQFPLKGVLFSYAENFIEGKDWNEEWEKNYFKPITIGDECIIHASFHEIEKPYRHQIIIDPKMAFGTGNHETTRLMINEILKEDMQGKKVLDMGCGTAVLGILATLRGAKKVVAIDIDEWAYNNALENIRLNHTEEISVLLGGAEVIPQAESFDIILANINRNILLNDIATYVTILKEGGLLCMSGFYKEDIPAIEEECNKYNLKMINYTEKNNWVAVKFQLSIFNVK
ncbi:MAG: 50S ribosomal protein L11 methyltransferase [Tannerellaceae bacterium]|nr:50S ribosomal protein L11 methyltransferase [Tannerellaceae bacterium]